MPGIIERYDSREITAGVESPAADLLYVASGTEDDAVVRALVEATIPAFYSDLVFQTYHINHLGGGVWEVSARYGKKEPKETGESSFNFDTGDPKSAFVSRRTARPRPATAPALPPRPFGRRGREPGQRGRLGRPRCRPVADAPPPGRPRQEGRQAGASGGLSSSRGADP